LPPEQGTCASAQGTGDHENLYEGPSFHMKWNVLLLPLLPPTPPQITACAAILQACGVLCAVAGDDLVLEQDRHDGVWQGDFDAEVLLGDFVIEIELPPLQLSLKLVNGRHVLN
jgi:hypothetical protein